ncbi:hypothetical protein LTR96_006390 [Exophiala xenobiotica]|nr:hypothetical protein LTR96_006390 [Exophiala xenobiotica]KAK5293026.1 hypothetical protein LTR14_005375 [Exophiala xenobiotica]KAK5336877.1 hypothetical protein LTR98_007183 [Exophiala xenobiotica]KAK5484628.1 hypothetical protein LTR55_006124 [Exophiala xenobiotica]
MVFYQIFHCIATLAAAFIHMYWNELVKTILMAIVSCLSNPREPLSRSMVKLHSLVLICFVFGLCFNAVSASSEQALLPKGSSILTFDDIDTPDGFGNISAPYNGLFFDGFYAFDPSDASLKGIIYEKDLNCAVSKPNALYGTRDNFELNTRVERRPSIRHKNDDSTFTLHALKIKPLDMPLGLVTISLQGFRSGTTLNWDVDFPAGFHNVLDVRLEEFSGQVWDGLERLEIWADFQYNDVSMDWEFCVDNIEVELASH